MRASRPALLDVGCGDGRFTADAARHAQSIRNYSIYRFRSLFDGFHGLSLVGLVPYFPTLRIWMAMPIVGRLARWRIRRCVPEEAQVVIAAAVKL